MRIQSFKYITVAILALAVLWGCQDEDKSFGPVVAPSNLQVEVEIIGQDTDNPNGDGSGIVNFKMSADNALAYRFTFGDASEMQLADNGEISHRYVIQGTNTYVVTAIASGTGGAVSSQTVEVTVFSAFDDVEARSFLTGAPLTQDEDGNDIIDVTEPYTKTWYVADSKNGHLGVGPSVDFDITINGEPSQFYFPAFFAAAPGQICGGDPTQCLCSDELTFTLLPEDNVITYVLNNNGETFFNGGHQDIVGGPGGEDACFEFDTSGTSIVALAPTAIDWSQLPESADLVPRETQLIFQPFNFMGYYVSSSEYEILEISEDELYVRTKDGLNPDLAWYHRFTTTPPLED